MVARGLTAACDTLWGHCAEVRQTSCRQALPSRKAPNILAISWMVPGSRSQADGMQRQKRTHQIVSQSTTSFAEPRGEAWHRSAPLSRLTVNDIRRWLRSLIFAGAALGTKAPLLTFPYDEREPIAAQGYNNHRRASGESGRTGIVRSGTLRVDGPDFEEQAAIETRVAFGNLRGFLEIVGENEPVAANHFLGFAKRAVCDHFFPRDRFSFTGEPLSAFHLSLINQSIKPDIESVDRALYFIPRKVFVPLSTGNYQVFG